MNLCGGEYLCKTKQDCCHKFVRDRVLRRDAQRVFQAQRSLKESIDRDETKVLCNTSHEQFIITSNFQLYCQIYLRLVYSHGLYKFVIFILVFFAFRYIFQL